MVANSSAADRLVLDRVRTSRVGATFWLTSIVLGSGLIRVLAAVAHRGPAYFPDEYIYASLGRSVATHGRPLIRGQQAHFPALLEPLLAAPLWALASLETAYHLVQAENAIFMSLAAIPVYLLARRLELGTGYALGCATFAVASPDLVFSGSILADPVAYPLALGALYAGVVALQRPSARAQLAFVALAGLASFARIQYVVLAPAFVVAAFLIDRRGALRTQRWALGVFGAGGVAVLIVGAGHVLGYYSSLLGNHLGVAFARWLGLELFLVALAGGVVLAPGAVIGLASARNRRDRAFTALVVPFALAVLVEGALYASNAELPRFKERYLMALLPLLPLAFGLYLRRLERGRIPVTLLAASIAMLAALLPLSGYAAGSGFDDSPLLWAMTTAEWRFGIAGASFAFAAFATVGAAVAAAVAWGRWPRLALPVALAAVVALSVGATRFDVEFARQVRHHLTAPNPSWVDAAQLGGVAAIETELTPSSPLIQQLFWNRSITQELLLGRGAIPTDAFAVAPISIARNGELSVQGHPLRTPILFQGMAVTPVLAGFERVKAFATFSLWRPVGVPRLRLLETGRYGDGWLGLSGTLRIWPGSDRGGTVAFTLSLPRTAPQPVALRFARRTYRLAPGERVGVRLRVGNRSPWSTTFTVQSGAVVLANMRAVSMRSTTPVFTPR